jgi:hypothetical protein
MDDKTSEAERIEIQSTIENLKIFFEIKAGKRTIDDTTLESLKALKRVLDDTYYPPGEPEKRAIKAMMGNQVNALIRSYS